MDFEAIDALRERHPAWRLLRTGNATLILSFLGDFFVEGNRVACSVSEVAAALDDHLYVLNTEIATDNGEARFTKEPRAYLEDWAATGYLRRFYPLGDEEVHYDVTPAFEKAYAWVGRIQGRAARRAGRKPLRDRWLRSGAQLPGLLRFPPFRLPHGGAHQPAREDGVLACHRG